MKYMDYVCAGSLLSFAPSLSAIERDDILSSTLYMQLASNKKYSALNSFSEWSDTYVLLLKRLGYDVSGPHEYSFFSSAAHREVRFACVIKATLGPLLLPEALAHLDQLMQRLGTHGEALERLARGAVKSRDSSEGGDAQVNRVTVQVGSVNKVAELRLVTVNLVTCEPVEANLFNQTFVMSRIVGKIEVQYVVAQLGEDYAQVSRAQVLHILGGRREEEIEQLG